jgi:hypothetical protein
VNLKYGVAIFLYVWIVTFISCSITWRLAFKSGVRSGYFRGKADGIRVGVTRG